MAAPAGRPHGRAGAHAARGTAAAASHTLQRWLIPWVPALLLHPLPQVLVDRAARSRSSGSAGPQGFDALLLAECLRLLEDGEVRVRLAVGQLLRSLAAAHGQAVYAEAGPEVLRSIHEHFVSGSSRAAAWAAAGGQQAALQGAAGFNSIQVVATAPLAHARMYMLLCAHDRRTAMARAAALMTAPLPAAAAARAAAARSLAASAAPAAAASALAAPTCCRCCLRAATGR